AGAGRIAEVVNRNGEAAMHCENGAHLPAARDGIDRPVHVLPEFAIAAEGYVISGIAVKHAGYVVIAETVVEIQIIGVFLKRLVGTCLAGSAVAVPAVVTRRVGQTFRPR